MQLDPLGPFKKTSIRGMLTLFMGTLFLFGLNGAINGRYQLHETLGQGGMGIVYRATDRLTGETVAL